MAQTKEELAVHKHEYYLRNKVAYIERAKKWAKENPDKWAASVAKSQKKYMEKNKDDLRQKAKERREKKKLLHPKEIKPQLTPEEKRAIRNERANKWHKTEKGREYYKKNKVKQLKRQKEKYKSQKKTPGQVLQEMRSATTEAK